MDLREFLNRQNWIFAKTYANKAPHEYCLREKVNGTDDEFKKAVAIIREYGVPAYFWGHEHIYLFLDGKMYWTMGAPVDETALINRCNISDYRISVSWRGRNGSNL